MDKTPKTIAVKVLQGNYGYGWDDIAEYDPKDEQQMKELKDDKKVYAENETNVPHRVIERRIPNPEYKKEKELNERE